MNIQMLYLILCMQAIVLSCGSNGTAPPDKGAVQADSNALAIVFNPVQQNLGPRDPKNWCNNDFSEAIPIFPDPVNSNRRYFYVEKGLYKLGVSFGNISSRLMLRKTDNGNIELSTSENFPTCLSNRMSFSETADANRVRYDNAKHIQFDLMAFPEGNVVKIVLELDLNAGYGIAVYRSL